MCRSEFEGDDGDDDGDEDEFGMEEEDSDEDSEEDSDEDSDEEGIPLFSHPEVRAYAAPKRATHLALGPCLQSEHAQGGLLDQRTTNPCGADQAR